MSDTIHSRAGTDSVLPAIALVTCAYGLFSIHDAAIKLLVTGFTVWQVMAVRSVTILTGFVLAGRFDLFRDAARSPILKAMAFRSLVILAAWVCFYSAAAHLQLAELTTIYFVAPVIVTLLSIPLLGEKVSPLRWIAVLTGFVGVFIACNPTMLGISLPVGLTLAAACLWAYSVILLRQVAQAARTSVQMVLNNSFFLLMIALPAIYTWTVPSWSEAALLLGMGVLAGGAQFTLFEGIKRASASVIAPFEYTALIWAFLLGYLIWQDVPRFEVFVGAILIVGAGVLIVIGEARRR